MRQLSSGLRAGFLVLSVIGLAGSSSQADIVLEQYEFVGQAGNQILVAPSVVASGLSGLNVTEGAGLVASAGANSINASGWNNANAYYSLGFNVNAGLAVTVDQIILTSRSSGTGPGFISVQASVDGGAFSTVASITQTGTAYNDELLAIAPVTAAKSLVFHFLAANQTSAAGGTIGSAGTFRLGDYNPPGTSPTPFTLNGTIAPAAVPEPSALALTALGLVTAGAVARVRRRGA